MSRLSYPLEDDDGSVWSQEEAIVGPPRSMLVVQNAALHVCSLPLEVGELVAVAVMSLA